ncbi:MAG TPA: hypothetical protein VNX02_08870 [Steroidobacteraceae bacterium]|jgi:hypothetical protein|nr:hypothetical protein [Steroidobacteraceae bacterium]
MPSRMTRTFPETALERILQALECELVVAMDEEILEAADDLGMQPGMKGSAAFLGLRYPDVHRPEEFFDPEWMARVLNDPRRIWLASAAGPVKPAPARAPPRAAARTRRSGRKPPRPPKEPTDG